MNKENHQLPNFIGIGTQRAGTTWIYECFLSHPQIFIPHQKELRFFSDIKNNQTDNNNINWYLNQFRGVKGENAIGEITPEYSLDATSAKKIYELLGDVKIIFVVRNPIDRIVSSYGRGLREGIWKCSLEHFVMSNMDFCVDRGMYFTQIERYFQYFPRRNVLIKVYEDSLKNPRDYIYSIYDFLEVNPEFRSSVENKFFNIGIVRKSISVDLIVRIRDGVPGLKQLLKNIQRTKYGNRLVKLLLSSTDENYKNNMSNSQHLYKIYHGEIYKLSQLLERDLNIEWEINHLIL